MEVIVLAAAGAAMFALASVLQHGAAGSVPVEEAGPLRLFGHLVRSRRWLLGKGADVAALGLQALALAHGTLMTVQAVLAGGLVLALVGEARLANRRLRTREWHGALLIGAGVVLLVVVGRPDGHGATAGPVLWVAVCVLAAASVGGALRLPRQFSVPSHGVVLAVTAGLCFALDAGFLKVMGASMGDDWRVTVTAVTGFAVAALIGNVVIQRAFQMASFGSTVPTLTATEPVAGLVLGTLLFREGLHRGLPAHMAGLIGIVALAGGCLALAGAETGEPGLVPAEVVMGSGAR